MRVRRLNRYKRWVNEPTNYEQEIGAVFGKMRCEPRHTVGPEGIEKWANPWALDFVEDVRVAAAIAGESELEEEVQWKPLCVFGSRKKEFASIDFKILRASEKSVQIPMWGGGGILGYNPTEQIGGEGGEAVWGQYVCDILTEGGEKCGARFENTLGLRNHKRFQRTQGTPNDHIRT